MLGLGSSDTNIKAIITAEDKASSVLKGFGDNVGSLGGFVEKGLKTAAIGLAAAGAAAVAFGVVSVKAFSESEDIIAQTNAVLKSTGQVAGVTADQVGKLATALEKTTKYSDEDVRSAENLLLTFTAIGKDIFPQATKTVLDMSTALGQDLKSSSIQVGKALQDPILGVTALRRVGVNFSQAQQDVIAKLVETGQKAKAQQLILKELNTEFGGSAEAAGNTFTGALAKLGNQFNNVQESIGGLIVNALLPLVTAASDAVAAVDWDKVLNNTTTALRLFWGAIAPILQFFVSTGKAAIEGLKKAFDFLLPSLLALWKVVETQLFPALKRLWIEVIVPLAPVIGTVLVAAVWLLINSFTISIQVLSTVINIFVTLFGFFTKTLPDAISGFVKFVGDQMTDFRDHFFERVGESIGFFATLPIKLPFLMLEAITKVIGVIASVDWGSVFKALGDAAWHIGDSIWNAIKSAWDKITNLNWGQVLLNIGKGVGNSIIDLIQGALNGALKGLPGSPQIHLPHFAKGVKNFGGGLAVVGEEGPEIVNLPRGSGVIPNNQIGQMSGGGGNITIAVNVGLYAGSEMEKRAIATELFKSLKDVASSKSTTVGAMLGGA